MPRTALTTYVVFAN